ncbi:Hypothetical predicted protein [Olea europaea subsp. europaea]|uniref:Uncharacterized protein n=1 Tax=Olea europaea subsp. europaea TaxID=158383 RepID=A0A8S0PL30_OLEEU|nr:Hypothetical predicted protein [Olea europaea subsp. europaea]
MISFKDAGESHTENESIPSRFKRIGKIPKPQESPILSGITMNDFLQYEEEARIVGTFVPEKGYYGTMKKKFGQFIFFEGADPTMMLIAKAWRFAQASNLGVASGIASTQQGGAAMLVGSAEIYNGSAVDLSFVTVYQPRERFGGIQGRQLRVLKGDKGGRVTRVGAVRVTGGEGLTFQVQGRHYVGCRFCDHFRGERGSATGAAILPATSVNQLQEQWNWARDLQFGWRVVALTVVVGSFW